MCVLLSWCCMTNCTYVLFQSLFKVYLSLFLHTRQHSFGRLTSCLDESLSLIVITILLYLWLRTYSCLIVCLIILTTLYSKEVLHCECKDIQEHQVQTVGLKYEINLRLKYKKTTSQFPIPPEQTIKTPLQSKTHRSSARSSCQTVHYVPTIE